jgi:hypothetical protein
MASLIKLKCKTKPSWVLVDGDFYAYLTLEQATNLEALRPEDLEWVKGKPSCSVATHYGAPIIWAEADHTEVLKAISEVGVVLAGFLPEEDEGEEDYLE